jgi:hypothetical protein
MDNNKMGVKGQISYQINAIGYEFKDNFNVCSLQQGG